MATKLKREVTVLAVIGLICCHPTISRGAEPVATQTSGGWLKWEGNPVLGGKLGTCFDVCVVRGEGKYRMYFSWRPKKAVALVESADGVHWGAPVVVLGANSKTDWEADVNRPVVVKRGETWHMWYTGQARGNSWIGFATSSDGRDWKRVGEKPVLSAELGWEKAAVMCPHVIWDEGQQLWRMWYSGGEQYEPDAIGYATSKDGVHWEKREEPVFKADPASAWEKHKVTACQVVPEGGGYLMFYIGFSDVNHAQIGMARSKDGVSGWERYPGNPIIRPTPGGWDADACYKPFAVFDGTRWMLWYNGRRKSVEQIGVAVHEGRDVWGG